MHIDENGDAEGNFTVVTLLEDIEVIESLGMSMQPVGYFQYQADGRKLPVSIHFKIFITKAVYSSLAFCTGIVYRI